MSEANKTGNVSIDVHACDLPKTLPDLCDEYDRLETEYQSGRDVLRANGICSQLNSTMRALDTRVKMAMDTIKGDINSKEFTTSVPHSLSLSELVYFNTWFAMRGGWRRMSPMG